MIAKKEKTEVAQSCPTLCYPMDCCPPGYSLHRDSPGKNTGAGCHFLLQGIFPIQGSNPGLPHCRQTLYLLSHKGTLIANRYLQLLCSVSQSCATLCDPMNCSLPGSSVHGIFQATILEQTAIFSCRGSS